MDQRQLQLVLKLQDQASAELKKFVGGVQSVDKSAKGATSTMGGLTKQVARFAAGWLSLRTAFSAVNMGVQVASQLETAEVGLKTLLGSAEEASATIEEIKDAAKRTPFELPGLTQAVQLLSSVTHDGHQSIKILLDIGEALAAMGKGQAELDRIIVNLQQVGAIGHASMIDIKQFAYAGIPIFEMLQKQTGLAGDALADFISDGQVTFDLLISMFDRANDEGGQFFGAYENNAGTFAQVTSNMHDALGIFAAELATSSGTFDTLKGAMGGVTVELGALTESMASSRGETGKTNDTSKEWFRVLAYGTEFIVNAKVGIGFLARAFVNLGSYIAEGITMLVKWDTSVHDSFVAFRQELVEAEKEAANFAIDLHNNNQQLFEDWNKNTTVAAEAGEEGAKAYEMIGQYASKASKEVADANKAIADTQQKIADLRTKYQEDIMGQSTSFGQAVVKQEEKVRDLKQRIADEEDSKRLDQLEEQLAREQAALSTRKILYKAYEDEIQEARRRASLTDFERELEDIARRGGELQKEFDKKMALLQQELDENQRKRSEIAVINKGITADVQKEAEKQTAIVTEEVTKQIQQYARLSAARARSLSVSEDGAALVSSHSFRAAGGPVAADHPYIVGERGPELFVPRVGGTIVANNQLGAAGGVQVNVYGDVSGSELVEKVTHALGKNLKMRERFL